MTTPPKVKKIDHVALQTDDINRAVGFYTDCLGAEVLSRQKFKQREMAWLSLGGIKLELFSKREDDTLEPWSDYYSGPVHLAFVVDDVDEFLEGAKAAGAELHPSHPEPFFPPVPNPPKIAYLLGPDGEEVEIREAENQS